MEPTTMKRSVTHCDRDTHPLIFQDATTTSKFSKPFLGTRRKRSSEVAFPAEDSHPASGDEENKRILRQHTRSTTSIKAIQARVKKLFDSVENESFPQNFPSVDTSCAGSVLPISKPSSPFEPKVLDQPLAVLAHARNVHLASSGVIHHTPSTSPFIIIAENDRIDDHILRWDMDALPSIPSPPDSPERTNPDTNHAELIAQRSATPFSEPIDDDDSSDSDIPFSSLIAKPPVRLFHEDMAVRKVKSRQKLKTSSMPPHHIPSSSYRATPLIIKSDVNDPFHPLPLRRLGRSTSAQPYPWAEAAQPQSILHPTVSTFFNDPLKQTRQDPYDLSASDCELSIAFPETSHYEVWDMDDESCISCPVLLCLLDKGDNTGSSTELAEPDISFVEIICDDVTPPNHMTRYDINNEYSIVYSDLKTGTATDKLLSNRSRPYSTSGKGKGYYRVGKGGVGGNEGVHGGGLGLKADIGIRSGAGCSDEIEVDGRWSRIYSRPQPKAFHRCEAAPVFPHSPRKNRFGHGKGHTRTSAYTPASSYTTSPSKHHPNLKPNPSSTIPFILTQADVAPRPASSTPTTQGFYLKVWIPIPLRLFLKRETRVFHVQARVWMHGDEERHAFDRLDSWVVQGGHPLDLDDRLGSSGDGYGNGIGAGVSPQTHSRKSSEGRPNGLIADVEMSVSHLRTWRWL